MNTLTKVKKIMNYLTYVSYHLKLENKFLMDEFAMPPQLAELIPHSNTLRDLCQPLSDESKGDSSCIEGNKVAKKSVDSVEDTDSSESEKFEKTLVHVILSSSPFCFYPLPYLLSVEGERCPCREFIPNELYWSWYLIKQDEKLKEYPSASLELDENQNSDVIMKMAHPFTDPGVIVWSQDPRTQRMLADYRACGGLVDLKMYREFDKLQKRRRKEVNVKHEIESNGMSAADKQLANLISGKMATGSVGSSITTKEGNLRKVCNLNFNHMQIRITDTNRLRGFLFCR